MNTSENALIRKMVKVAVEAAFDAATAQFRENPGGNVWQALEDAMWALQGIKFLTDEELGVLNGTGIGRWTRTIREMRENKHGN